MNCPVEHLNCAQMTYKLCAVCLNKLKNRTVNNRNILFLAPIFGGIYIILFTFVDFLRNFIGIYADLIVADTAFMVTVRLTDRG